MGKSATLSTEFRSHGDSGYDDEALASGKRHVIESSVACNEAIHREMHARSPEVVCHDGGRDGMKGLVIDGPWIGLILEGQKTWEMRSRHTLRRGLIALIRKGTGQVVGVTQVTATHGPLSLPELEASLDRHRVPLEEFRSGRAMAWNVAWELAESVPLPQPVRYRHPPGAVIWVDLDEATTAQVLMQIDSNSAAETHRSFAAGRAVASATCKADARSVTATSDASAAFGDPLVPVANDRTWFGPHLLKAGQFTIGAKGEEIRVDSFPDALEALRKMKVPRWRRPNPQGNWGIVSGMAWKRLSSFSESGSV